MPRLADLRAGRGQPALTTLLSPFDNLIWNRGRMEELWGFHYRIEVYTPAPKRVYGYYSMPILHRGKLVGRLDPSLDRKNRLLTVRKIFLEPGERPTESLATAIAGALWKFADVPQRGRSFDPRKRAGIIWTEACRRARAAGVDRAETCAGQRLL